MKIVFFCNWGVNSEKLLEKYKLFTKNNSGIFDSIEGVTDINIADAVIFIEGIPNNFNIRLLENKKIFCFPREPYVLIKNWEKFKFKYGFTYNNFYHVVTNPQFINKTYDFLNELKYNVAEKNLSCIVSNKSGSEGHNDRKNFIIKLSNIEPNLCDIYGYGWKNELNTLSYKGELDSYHNYNNNNSKTKFEALTEYKYSICIENCQRLNYFTEKFTDAILCWTIPIYYGCTNICDYFPEHSYYCIDINDPSAIEKIKNIVEKPITKENIKAMEIARNLILNKYNIWATINNIQLSKIHVIGDSHTAVFSGTNLMNPKYPHEEKDSIDIIKKFKTYRINAGTAYHSKIKATPIIEEIIDKYIDKYNDYIIFCYGEVDCRAHLIKQIIMQKRDHNVIIEECVDKLMNTICHFKNIGYNVIAYGPVATFRDVNKQRVPIDRWFGNENERNKVTYMFNSYYKKKCDEHNIPFFTCFYDLIDNNWNTLEGYHANDCMHYSQNIFPIIERELKKMKIY